MRRILLIALFLSCAAGRLTADDEASFKSPKATTKTLLTFLKNGEIDRVPECFVEPRTAAERDLLLYGLSDDAWLPAVHHALVAKFGEQASPLRKTLASFDQQLQVIDSMEQTIEGINGRLSVKGFNQGSVAFVDVGGEWKLSLVPSFMLRSVARERLAAAQERRELYLDTIQQIEQGKFKSAEEAMQALQSRGLIARTTNAAQPRR
jgi:hypothetical protein